MKIQKLNLITLLWIFLLTVIISPTNYKQTNNVMSSSLSTKHKKKTETKYIRGIHLSAWISGSEKRRKVIMKLFDDTELNTAIIDVKEYSGQVYIDGIKIVEVNNAYVKAIPNIRKYISDLKEKGIYIIARIVVFRDNILSRKNPCLAIKNSDGTIWFDKNGIAWLDPYNKNNWDYNLKIAEKAADIGFDEIQFDYIRFPSDGNTKNCRYSKPHSAYEASKALVGFLKEANKRLKNKNTKISADIFGLTTTATNDMGIGQKITEMTKWVDYVSPMLYPSHYSKWNYGIVNPNKEPYKIICFALKEALKKISIEKLRPWLQDFSLGCKYGENEVKAQIQACYDNKIMNWMLWNPKCIYTENALKRKNTENIY